MRSEPSASSNVSRNAGRTLPGSTTIPNRYDLIVVGAGSGGYAAARTARDLGANVALVDEGPLGGLCILRGCMPSKTLLATGDRLHEIRHSAELGVRVGAPELDFRGPRRTQAPARARLGRLPDRRDRDVPAVRRPGALRVADDAARRRRGPVRAPVRHRHRQRRRACDRPGPGRGRLHRQRCRARSGTGPALAHRAWRRLRCSELGQFFHRAGVPTTFVLRAKHLCPARTPTSATG